MFIPVLLFTFFLKELKEHKSVSGRKTENESDILPWILTLGRKKKRLTTPSLSVMHRGILRAQRPFSNPY